MSQRTDANWSGDDIRDSQLEFIDETIADVVRLSAQLATREDRTEVFYRLQNIVEWLKGVSHKDQVFGIRP